MCLIPTQQIFAGKLFTGIQFFKCLIFLSYKIAFSVKTDSIIFRNNVKLTVEDSLIKLSFSKHELQKIL